MKDFMDMEASAERLDSATVLHTLRHRTKKNILVEFKSGNQVQAESMGAFIIKALRAYSKRYREKTLKSMTPGQRAFYDKLIEFHKMEGRAPSYEEQCVIMGCSSKGTPHYYVKKLVELGWVWLDEDGMVIPIDIAPPDMED